MEIMYLRGENAHEITVPTECFVSSLNKEMGVTLNYKHMLGLYCLLLYYLALSKPIPPFFITLISAEMHQVVPSEMRTCE
mgnify:CR=1 FL=1